MCVCVCVCVCVCGKFVIRLKHVRLKITSVTCAQSDLPVVRWLDQNRKDLETFNQGGHDLDWNRRHLVHQMRASFGAAPVV